MWYYESVHPCSVAGEDSGAGATPTVLQTGHTGEFQPIRDRGGKKPADISFSSSPSRIISIVVSQAL